MGYALAARHCPGPSRSARLIAADLRRPTAVFHHSRSLRGPFVGRALNNGLDGTGYASIKVNGTHLHQHICLKWLHGLG